MSARAVFRRLSSKITLARVSAVVPPSISGVLQPAGSTRPESARLTVLKGLNKSLMDSHNMVDLCLSSQNWSLANALAKHRNLIFSVVKRAILKNAIKQTAVKVTASDLTLSKAKAAERSKSGIPDSDGSFCLFSQAFRVLHYLPVEKLRVAEGERGFAVKFSDDKPDESPMEAPALYKYTLSEFSKELQSDALPLLLPLPKENSSSTTYWIPNPGAVSAVQLEMLAFLGKLLGICLRSKDTFPIRFAPVVWKALVNEEVTIADVQAINPFHSRAVSQLRDIATGKSKIISTAEQFEALIQETFTIVSADGRIVELVPDGKSKKVRFDNLLEYCNLCDSFRVHELDSAAEAIRAGLAMVIPPRPLGLFCGYQLQALATGLMISATEALAGAKWMYKIVLPAGAKLRSGIELSSEEIQTIDTGSLVEVLERRVNAENIPRLRVARGWISEMLNPASGSTGPVSEMVPMLAPLRFQVTAADGCIVRQAADINSQEVSRLACGDMLDASSKLFGADNSRWVRLLDNSGYVWWANNVNEDAALKVVGPTPVNQA